MSIRMKEWGMARMPESSVYIPLQGLTRWEETGRALGRGLGTALLGSAELLEQSEHVNAQGELAAFSAELHRIGQETAAELAENNPEDWDAAWQQVSAPRLAEAIRALPPAARNAGAELAEAFNSRAALQAKQQAELNNLKRARHNWQQRVEDAVKRGNPQQIENWLNSGAGVFIPEQEVAPRQQELTSKACTHRWEQALRSAPLDALKQYLHATPEQLPSLTADQEQIAALATELQQHSRRTIAEALANGTRLPEPQLEQAHAAGILSQTEFQHALLPAKTTPIPMLCDWMRRIDECAEDANAQTELLMALGTTPMEPKIRQQLKQRIESCRHIAEADRRAFSRALHYLYAEGAFGAPGDTAAQQRLKELQTTGLQILQEHGTEASARWLLALPRLTDTRIYCANSN